MARKCYKFYSVYKSGTDEPVIIHATATECEKAMGIKPCTFRSYLSFTKSRHRKLKYDVYLDDPEEDDTDE